MAVLVPSIYVVALYCSDVRWAVRKRLFMAGVSAETIKTKNLRGLARVYLKPNPYAAKRKNPSPCKRAGNK